MLLFLFFFVLVDLASGCEVFQKTNLFIGSSGFAYGYGAVSPAAQVPFGAMRLGPDTASTIPDIEFRHFSGYNYNDIMIRGFSHTRLVGAGLSDFGNFGLMPIRSPPHALEANMLPKYMTW
jgi:putative alpha-1,2-mannosidase